MSSSELAERTCRRPCSDVDRLNLILPRGELTGLTAHLYQDSPIARVTNLLAQRAVLEIVQRLPSGKIR